MSQQKELDMYEQFWDIADKNRDGRLTIEEMAKAIRKYKPTISDCEIAGMFCAVDIDEDKTITKKEFMTAMVEKQKRSKAMLDLFKKYDKDNSKTLSRGEVLQMIKDCFPKERVNYIVGEFLSYSDLDGNGQVTFDEFCRYFG